MITFFGLRVTCNILVFVKHSYHKTACLCIERAPVTIHQGIMQLVSSYPPVAVIVNRLKIYHTGKFHL